MSQDKEQVCPWCHTEIMWDPEIGPESECPHCLNELGDYRSIKVKVDENLDESEDADSPDFDDDLEEDAFDDDAFDNEAFEEEEDIYRDRVAQCLDTQIEVPECYRCQELMLLSGTLRAESSHFSAEKPAVLSGPLLAAPFEMQVYVCPSCFKTETYLSEEAKNMMIDVLKK